MGSNGTTGHGHLHEIMSVFGIIFSSGLFAFESIELSLGTVMKFLDRDAQLTKTRNTTLKAWRMPHCLLYIPVIVDKLFHYFEITRPLSSAFRKQVIFDCFFS